MVPDTAKQKGYALVARAEIAYGISCNWLSKVGFETVQSVVHPLPSPKPSNMTATKLTDILATRCSSIWTFQPQCGPHAGDILLDLVLAYDQGMRSRASDAPRDELDRFG